MNVVNLVEMRFLALQACVRKGASANHEDHEHGPDPEGPTDPADMEDMLFESIQPDPNSGIAI